MSDSQIFEAVEENKALNKGPITEEPIIKNKIIEDQNQSVNKDLEKADKYKLKDIKAVDGETFDINTNKSQMNKQILKEDAAEKNAAKNINEISEKSVSLIINDIKPESIFRKIEESAVKRIDEFFAKDLDFVSNRKDYKDAKEEWIQSKNVNAKADVKANINKMIVCFENLRELTQKALNEPRSVGDRDALTQLRVIDREIYKVVHVWEYSAKDVSRIENGGVSNPYISGNTAPFIKTIEESNERLHEKNKLYDKDTSVNEIELMEKTVLPLLKDVKTDKSGNPVPGEEEKDKWNQNFIANSKEVFKAQKENNKEKLDGLKQDRFKLLDELLTDFLRYSELDKNGMVITKWVSSQVCDNSKWLRKNFDKYRKLTNMGDAISAILEKAGDAGSLDKEYFDNLSSEKAGLYDALKKKIELTKAAKELNQYCLSNLCGIDENTGNIIKFDKKKKPIPNNVRANEYNNILSRVKQLEDAYTRSATNCEELRDLYDEEGIYIADNNVTLESALNELNKKRESEKHHGDDAIIGEITQNTQMLINILGKDFSSTTKNEEYKNAYLEGMQTGYRTLIASCNKFLSGHENDASDIARVRIVERVRALCMNESILMEGMADSVAQDIKSGELSDDLHKEERENLTWKDVLSEARAEKISTNDERVHLSRAGANSSDVLVIEKDGKKRYFKQEEYAGWNYSYMKNTVEKSIMRNANIPNEAKEEYKRFAKELMLALEDDTKAGSITDVKASGLLSKIAKHVFSENDTRITFEHMIADSFKDNAQRSNTIKKVKEIFNKTNDYKVLTRIFAPMKKTFFSKHLLQNNGYIPNNAKSSSNNVATSRIAKLLGIGDMVVESKTAIINVNGMKVKGNLMEDANAKDFYQNADVSEYSGNAKKQLCNLAVFDFLMGQADRHGANFLVTRKKHGWFGSKIDKIRAIDNDVSCGMYTGKQLDGYKDILHSAVRLQGLSNKGKPLLKFMDKDFADAILALNPTYLEFVMLDLLTPKQINAMKDRLIYIQNFIKATRTDNTVKYLKSNEEWERLGVDNSKDWDSLNAFNPFFFSKK